ncbi:TetR/AcrR family transcriptional regulator [Spirillospora sp. NPDC048823]|uniref:TetR/AcrR family transcriptional regulator n=1 Tax=unclassified Spirillospora TaxID=2642701 RepID=UPI0037248923
MAAIETPRNARSRRTSQALLKAARELIEQQGPAAATMAAVAERAGVSRRAIYLHFSSRSDLLAALVDYLNEVEDHDAAFRPLWEAADGIAALDARAQMAADFLPRIMPTARAIQQATRHDPDAVQHWEVATASRYGGCRRAIELLADEGRLAPQWTIGTGADMLLALSSFDVIDLLLNERQWTRQQLADHLSALYRRVFVA